jgi:CRP-like cAMP-binding protein
MPLRLLQGFDDQCLGFITSHLRPAAFGKDEVVFECGDRGDEMYFVIDGAVLTRTGPLTTLTSAKAEDDGEEEGGSSGVGEAAGRGERLVGKGDVFGEAGLFAEELGLLRRESAKTHSWVSVYVLTAAALRTISLEYPEVSLWLLLCLLCKIRFAVSPLSSACLCLYSCA